MNIIMMKRIFRDKKPTRVQVGGTNRIDELPVTRNPPIVPEMSSSEPEPFQI